ncbi:MAG: HEAT repeat domain-containing protein [Planctomycetes bacterium]|nr:HEAT repeat domain-containing protein [Planctomycetota bacterium]
MTGEGSEQQQRGPLPGKPGPESAPDEIGIEPLSLSLLGRLFGIPLLIIGLIVGGAVCVVLLFGAPASPPQRTLEELVQALESDAGQKNSAGMLMPLDKAYWQAGLELAQRLEKEPIADAERAQVAVRLSEVVRRDIAHLESSAARADTAAQVRAPAGSTRLEFLVHALGRTKRGEAVDALIEVLRGGREPLVTIAVQQLGDLRELPESARAVEPLLSLLVSAVRPETRLTVCTALSVLAPRGDARVIDALATAGRKEEGEVAWSAALALARLGSSEGKSTLLDLLDRSFWENEDRYQVVDNKGVVHRYAMPPQRIEQWLLAAVDAAAGTDDPDLREMIGRLKSDPSPAVRSKAATVLQAGAPKEPGASVGPKVPADRAQ